MRVADGEAGMNQSTSRIEKMALIFRLREWGGLWAMEQCAGEGVGECWGMGQGEPSNWLKQDASGRPLPLPDS